ncbi:uncharacterized protein C9orf40 homolog [Elgaria multicarinata webbii]|uniref:uncharacterized protein C9orf40 homolog n=1 Tax=Elgaria multicarinata webbii TaxID=159646 RepID=UPI002FCCFD8F
MAKRGAEALACRAPYHSLLPHAPLPKRSRSDFERREPRCAALRHEGGTKRKRAEEEEGKEQEEGVAAVPSGKRPAALKGPAEERGRALSPSLLEGTTPQPTGANMEAEALAEGSKGRGTPELPAQHEDDVWHYNSFQYWRSPLPIIDLTDILDLEKIDTVEARDSSSVGLSEMET